MKRTFINSSNPKFKCEDSVILLPFGRSSYLAEIIKNYEAEKIEFDESTDREVYTIKFNNKKITLIYSGMGAPAAVNAVEMAAANGAKNLILFGACGGTSPKINVGDLIIPTGVVRGDGASKYYAPIEFPAAADPMLTAKLLRFAQNQIKTKIHNGFVYTTDASYRQGPEIYENYKDLVIGVECEASAVFVASSVCNLQSAALFFCTDNVMSKKSMEHKYRGLKNSNVRKGFESGLETILKLVVEI